MFSVLCVHLSLGEYFSSHGNCHLCDATCQLCTGPEVEDCISCPSSRYFDEGKCVIRCQRGRYAMNRQCHLCHHTCHECNDGGPDNCTSCDKDKYQVSRYLFGGECRDACPDSFSPSWRNRCEACPAHCSVCFAPDHCLHCSPAHYLKDGKCVPLECGEGEVENPEYEDCVPCEEGCKKCLQKNPRECLTCAEDYYQLGPDCYRSCPDRTYSAEDSMTCVRCEDRHCVNCDPQQCYWCEEGHYISDGECVEHCAEGFYVDEESQECEPCHRECRSCGGPNYDDCDSCEDDFTLTAGQCVDGLNSACAQKHYRNGEGDCQQCHPTCLSCSAPGKEDCNSCDPGHFLTSRQSCVSQCPQGAFGNLTSGRCDDCVAGCVLCLDGLVCQRCSTGHTHLYLQDGQCVAECHRGFPWGGECQPCAPNCASCLGNTTHCLSCELQYLLLEHSCRAHCPGGHYPQQGRCLRCPPDCTRCSTEGLCQECDRYYFLHEDRCVDDCPAGFFPSPEQKECVRCHVDCASCDGPDSDDCDVCKNPAAVRSNGECLPRCPSNTYHDTRTSECRDCDRSCKTCSGPEPSSCSSCGGRMRMDASGHCVFYDSCPLRSYKDSDGQCQDCHLACHRCTGPSKDDCLSCNAPLLLLNNTCVDGCPVGYYDDKEGRLCERCHFSCASCKGRHSVQCVTCKPGHFRLGRSCVESCGENHYGNATTMTCERCDPSCTQCRGGGDSQCLSCRDDYLLLPQGGRCLKTCPENFYPDTRAKTCRHCHPTCQTCSDEGALACTSCYHGYRQFAGICDSDCSLGFYTPSEVSSPQGSGFLGSEAECVPCDPSCLDCHGPGRWSCTVCPALYILADDGRCLSCCGETAHNAPLQHECCDCKSSYEECILGVNFVFGSPEELDVEQGGRPALFALISIFIIVAMGTVVFLLLRARSMRGPASKATSTGRYEKLGRDAGGADSGYGEYSDRILEGEEDDEEEEEDDIVYMGKDGMVYRRFKYGLLDEDEELELEYDDEESYTIT